MKNKNKTQNKQQIQYKRIQKNKTKQKKMNRKHSQIGPKKLKNAKKNK